MVLHNSPGTMCISRICISFIASEEMRINTRFYYQSDEARVSYNWLLAPLIHSLKKNTVFCLLYIFTCQKSLL